MAKEVISFSIDRGNVFSKALSKAAKKMGRGKAMKEIARLTVENAIALTPVKKGRAKAGWKPAADGLNAKYYNPGTDAAAKRKGASEGFFQQRLLRIKFANNVPYIVLLDKGYSSQNRKGIIIPAMRAAIRNIGKLWKKDVKNAVKR